MSETRDLVETKKDAIQQLADTFMDDSEKKSYLRDLLVVTNIKKITGADYQKRSMNAYEAFAYIAACRSMGLNPMLNHIIFLEDQLYITLAGHLQNAHASGQFLGMTMETTETGTGQQKEYKTTCTITKKVGDDRAEFRAEGVSSRDTIRRKKEISDLFVKQMSEARAMRRCLQRAFPVGLANYEDIEEDSIVEQPKEVKSSIIEEIENVTSLSELESMKEKVKAANTKEAIAAFASKKSSLTTKTNETNITESTENVGNVSEAV